MPFVVLAALIVITALWVLSLPVNVFYPARVPVSGPDALRRRVRGAASEPVIRDRD